MARPFLVPINKSDKGLRNFQKIFAKPESCLEIAGGVGLIITQAYIQNALFVEDFRRYNERFYMVFQSAGIGAAYLMDTYVKQKIAEIQKEEIKTRKKSKMRKAIPTEEKQATQSQNSRKIFSEYTISARRYTDVKRNSTIFDFEKFTHTKERRRNYATTVAGYTPYFKESFTEHVPMSWILMRTRYYEGRYESTKVYGGSHTDYYALISKGQPKNNKFIITGTKDEKKEQYYISYDNSEYLKTYPQKYGERAGEIFKDRAELALKIMFNEAFKDFIK